ncbi:MAG TPA: hypothetical protein VL287_18095 [Gemmatimonadales bacterium]|jgi:hypothetical protein|nr:hypothetical protein [Gemmatimonadales bacterium]
MTMADTPSGGWSDMALGESAPVPQPVGPASREGEAGAREQIRQVRDQVVNQAKTTFKQAKDRAASSLTDSRREAADQIGGLARAVHRTGEHLRNEDQPRIAGLADSLADQVDHVAGYLREAGLRTVGRDIENLARRQPALVYSAAFAVGLLAARFLKSSETASEPARDQPARLASVGGREPAGGFDARP